MRTLSSAVVASLLLCAACATDGSTAVPLNAAAALQDGSPVEPRIEAQVVLPVTLVADGQVHFEVRVTNRLNATVSSGACVDRVDAKPVTARQWIDATPEGRSCTRQLVSFTPGVGTTLQASADQAVLRALVGGSGGRVLLRARHVVWQGDAVFVMQSAEQEITVP